MKRGRGGGVVGSITPLGKVNSRQDPRFTGDSGVDLVVREHHGIHLDVLQVVTVVTEYSGQFHLSDLSELFEGEAAGPSSVLVPEPVSVTEVVELFADDAGKGGADHGSGERTLGDASSPEINVFGGGVHLGVGFDGVVGHDADHIIPSLHGGQTAPFPPSVVGGDTMLPTSLHVERCQIKTELLAWFLEKMIGDLLTQGVVHSLSDLVDKTHDVSICPASLVQIVGLLQHLGQLLGSDVTMSLGPSLYGGGKKRVPETESSGGEGRRC